MDSLHPGPWKFMGLSNQAASFCHLPTSMSLSSAFPWHFLTLITKAQLTLSKLPLSPLILAILSPGDEIDTHTQTHISAPLADPQLCTIIQVRPLSK